MAVSPFDGIQKMVAFAGQYPALAQNQQALTQLGSTLSPEDKANLGKVGINLNDPLASSPESLGVFNDALAKNPDAVKDLAALPSQARSEAFRQAAEKGQKGVYDLVALTEKTPSPTAAPTEPAQPQQPSAQTPPATAATPQAATTPTAQEPDFLKQMMASNPGMASVMSHMTEVIQGLMEKLMTGLRGFLEKIFGEMDGSGGGLLVASNNPGSNNPGYALAIGGADKHQRVSLQVGDNPAQETTVGELQQRVPGSAPTTPALDPNNRLALNNPQMEPGRA